MVAGDTEVAWDTEIAGDTKIAEDTEVAWGTEIAGGTEVAEVFTGKLDIYRSKGSSDNGPAKVHELSVFYTNSRRVIINKIDTLRGNACV